MLKILWWVLNGSNGLPLLKNKIILFVDRNEQKRKVVKFKKNQTHWVPTPQTHDGNLEKEPITLFFFFLNFILFLKFCKIVLVMPNIIMNPPQVYMCSPSWTLLPPPSPYHPSGSSQWFQFSNYFPRMAVCNCKCIILLATQ